MKKYLHFERKLRKNKTLKKKIVFFLASKKINLPGEIESKTNKNEEKILKLPTMQKMN